MTKVGLAALLATAAAVAGPAGAQPQDYKRCDGVGCASAEMRAERGNAEDKAGRKYYLDEPRDYRPGQKVIFVLNLHGAGSYGTWQRHYFPAVDFKDKYHLVIATPTAATETPMVPGQPGVRRWVAEADDAHLQNIVDAAIQKYGARNIKSFWLAGHSQGGMTSHRLVCTPYYASKVDGFLSLSGGRVGAAPFVARFGPPKPDGSPPDPRPAAAGLSRTSALPTDTCQFSAVFEVGQYEIESLPDMSPAATTYGCGARVKKADIVDSKPGHVWDFARAGYNVWGRQARPGTAQEWVYPKCRGGRVVADVVRQDKGHTEGLEPKVTEELVKLIAAEPGGKIARGG